MKHLVLLVAVLSLAACTGQSYDTELAQENQWKMLGVKDGENGRLVRTENELQKLSDVQRAHSTNTASVINKVLKTTAYHTKPTNMVSKANNIRVSASIPNMNHLPFKGGRPVTKSMSLNKINSG